MYVLGSKSLNKRRRSHVDVCSRVLTKCQKLEFSIRHVSGFKSWKINKIQVQVRYGF